MKQLIIGLAVIGMCVTSQFAFATGSPANSTHNNNTNKVAGGQTQKQSQGQSQSSEYSGENSQSVNVNTPRQAPSFGVYASGPCSGVSFALSTVLGGGGVGAIDRQCSIREAARIAGALGEKGLAL